MNAWTVSGQIGLVRTKIPEVKETVEKFFEDAEARKRRASTVSKPPQISSARGRPAKSAW